MRLHLAVFVVVVVVLHVAVGQPRPPPSIGDGPPPDHLVLDLAEMISDTDAMLIIMGDNFRPPPPGFPGGPPPSGPGGPRKICEGNPAIVTKTTALGSNQVCFGPDVATNLSCSCLDDYRGVEEWVFRLQAPEVLTALPPATLPNTTVLGVNMLLTFGLPETLRSVKLIAETSKPLSLELVLPPGPPGDNAQIALVRVPASNALESLTAVNINLSQVTIRPGFVPSRLKQLTLRNCNITRVPNDFLNDLADLTSIDLSSNQLAGAYQGVTLTQCLNDACSLRSLNLSQNAITTFPSYLLNLNKLEELDLSGNPIANATVDQTTYDSIAKLKVFKLDAVSESGFCTNGTIKTVQDAQLCLPRGDEAVASTAAPTKPVEPDNSNSFLMYGIIGGSLIIAIALFVVVRWRNARSPHGFPSSDKEDPLESFYDNTLSFDDTHPTVSASLLNDPIIITHRLPYKDIRVANCISKGGFGLVYSGVYNRRRVAIKKIRPEHSGDIKQIEQFLREICLMATLNHPRIVEFIGVSWDSLRNLCAVTEFMERGDLRDVLHGFKLRNNRLTWESHKLTFALHIAEALTYLHSLSPKVIHRDLKSKNVLVNGDMQAKLSDFGISRERRFEETHMTAGIGTSFWIAPEVLLGKDYDEHADIFSFGVVLSEIDTDDYPYWNGDNPNVGNKAQENMILQMVASGAMRPTFTDDCPKGILELADQCLHVDPALRPTAAEIVFKLQQLVQFSTPNPSTGGSSRGRSSRH